jgi:stress response protein YsnF
MLMADALAHVHRWKGHPLVARDGEEIGIIDDVSVEPDQASAWARVSGGVLGGLSVFVPMGGALPAVDDPQRLRVPFDGPVVRNSPHVEGATPTAEETAALYAHYGLPGGQVEITLSEERLHVGTRQRRVRMRLERYTVTEEVTVTVPVKREEVRLVRDGYVEDDTPLGLAADGESVVLVEEEPAVTREVVPRERVRLVTETVSEEATVIEPVRREEIGYEEERAAP